MAEDPQDDGPLGAEATRPDPPRRIGILLVEDDPDYVQVIQHLLQRTGIAYSVHIAYRVAEIGSRPMLVRPQVALVDQYLPDGSATDALDRIAVAFPDLPVLVLTAHGDRAVAVEVMKRGAYDYLIKGELNAERLAIALDHALERARLAQGLAQAQARLRDWAIRDELTGLYNRRHLLTRLEAELARAERHGSPLTVLMADLDHFKELNDTYGHAMGDEALRIVARILEGACRAADVVARYGGEEFVLVLPETSGRGGEQTADRVRATIAATPVRWAGETARLTVSVGVACLSDISRAQPQAIIDAADRALYSAKRAGRDRIHRLGRRTGPLGQVAQGSEIRRRLMDGFVGLLRGLDPEADERARRAVRLAEGLALAVVEGEGLDAADMQVLLTAARLAPLAERFPGGAEESPLAVALAATGVLGREARLLRRLNQPLGFGDALTGDPDPERAALGLAATLLALATAAAAFKTPAEASLALRALPDLRYPPHLLDALAALPASEEEGE